MIALALQSTLILGLAFAAAALIHNRPASWRRLLWLTVFSALALLPLLSRIPRFFAVEAPAMLTPVVVNVTQTATEETQHDWLFLIWAAGCALFLGRIVTGLAVISWRSSRALPSPYRIKGARVLTSAHIDSPVTSGAFRRTVLLPDAATTWPAERLRSMLAHESIHVVRRDAFWRLLSQIACAFYWPNPLAWLAAARLHAAMEQSCDDAVLETGIAAREYAGHLLDVSRSASLGEVAAGSVAMAGAAQLEARLRSILDPSRKRAPLSRASSVAAAALAFAVLAPIGVTRLTAQGSGAATLSGTVSDATGGRVPKALVTLSETKTGKVEAVYTGDDGAYTFPALPAGEYTMQVRQAGFAMWSEKLPRQLKAGDVATAHVSLNIGQLKETIEIKGERIAASPAPSTPGGPTRIRIGGNIQSAKLLHMVKPVYPDTARARNAEGPVLLRAIIGRDGSVESLDLLNTPTDSELATAVIEAVRQWKYQPTLLNGQPVGVVTEITINFTLGN